MRMEIALMIVLLFFGCTGPSEDTVDGSNGSIPASGPSVESIIESPELVANETALPNTTIPTEPGVPNVTAPEWRTPLPPSTLTPCRGRQTTFVEYNQDQDVINNPDGPWYWRVMVAKSDDGLTWKRTDRILMDAAGNPDAVVSNGRMYVYADHFCEERDWLGNLSVAISDDAKVWQYYKVRIRGWNTHMEQNEPDVVILPDGRFRLYFTSPRFPDTRPQCNDAEGRNTVPCAKLYSALSEDGINFVMEEDVRFELSGEPVVNPTVYYADGKYRLYSNGKRSDHEAESSDGLRFTPQQDYCPDRNGYCLRMANGIGVGDGYRFYAYDATPYPLAIYSLSSHDGKNWEVEEGVRLLLDAPDVLESRFVSDPVVAKLGETYWMFYTTEIPERYNATSLEYVTYGDIEPGYEQLYCDGYCDGYERSHPGSACHNDCRS